MASNENLNRLEAELLNNQKTSRFTSPVAEALYRNKDTPSAEPVDFQSVNIGINSIIKLFETQINLQTEQNDILRKIAESLAGSGSTKSSAQFKAGLSSDETLNLDTPEDWEQAERVFARMASR